MTIRRRRLAWFLGLLSLALVSCGGSSGGNAADKPGGAGGAAGDQALGEAGSPDGSAGVSGSLSSAAGDAASSEAGNAGTFGSAIQAAAGSPAAPVSNAGSAGDAESDLAAGAGATNDRATNDGATNDGAGTGGSAGAPAGTGGSAEPAGGAATAGAGGTGAQGGSEPNPPAECIATVAARTLATYQGAANAMATPSGLLLVSSAGGLTAYDPGGAAVWSIPGAGIPYPLDNGQILVAATDILVAADLATGEAMWSTRLQDRVEQTAFVQASEAGFAIVVGSDAVQVFSSRTGVYLQTILAPDLFFAELASDTVLAWTSTQIISANAPGLSTGWTYAPTDSLVLAGMSRTEAGNVLVSEVLASEERLTLLDVSSGEVIWQRTTAEQIGFALPGQGGEIYLAEGAVVMRLDETTGEVQWSTDMGTSVPRLASIVGDQLLFELGTDLVALLAGEGTESWTTPVGSFRMASAIPSADGTAVYAVTGDTSDSSLLSVLSVADGSLIFEYTYGGEAFYAQPGVGDTLTLVASDELLVLSNYPEATDDSALACSPCSLACADEQTVSRCLADGRGYEAFESCDEGLACVGGACVTCEANSVPVCSGRDVYWADSCGRRGDWIESCGTSEICENGACLPACQLYGCSENGFTYSCASSSSTASTHYQYDIGGVLTGATMTVSYSNDHTVYCTAYGTYLDSGVCQDDTAASCTW